MAGKITTTEPTNGFSPGMSDDELLTELTIESVGHSYKDVRLKFTQGEVERYRKIRLRSFDAPRMARLLSEMPEEEKQRILDATKHARSEAFADDIWLSTLAAVVLGLAQPHKLQDPVTKEYVWVPDGAPQDLAAAMIALPAIGLDFWQLEYLAREVMGITREIQSSLAGNS